MSKSYTQNHSILPAKREKARRVEDHHRNLNKQNHVDSRLNVKRIGFVLNSNTICNACNESLFFANHDNCVVRNFKSVNVKTPTAKHNVKTTKKVWKEKVVTVRVNRAESTHLPKKKLATFQEPPRPLNRPTQKIVVQQNKKPNIHVNLSTGVKPSTGASKPMSKSDTNHSNLLAKREKARRVKDHHRNLNKQNHVDSHLNVKRTGFVSNSNTICNACNESLVFANHDNCVVRNLKSMNVKTPTTKHNVKTTKKVWKAKVVTVRSQWKPTG
nr:hypothetical protein [Tanacetum cinerariifolium]